MELNPETYNLLKSPYARSDGVLPVWEITSKGLRSIREREALKKAALQSLLSEYSQSFLVTSESPADEGVSGSWKQVANGLWGIPENLVFDGFYSWLRPGNWLIYRALRRCDADQCKPLASCDFALMSRAAREIEADYAIYSFHDNDPWFLYLAPKNV
jgi:hypothetical protein